MATRAWDNLGPSGRPPPTGVCLRLKSIVLAGPFLDASMDQNLGPSLRTPVHVSEEIMEVDAHIRRRGIATGAMNNFGGNNVVEEEEYVVVYTLVFRNTRGPCVKRIVV